MRRLLLGLAGVLTAGVVSVIPSVAHAETTLCVGTSVKSTMKCDPGWAVNMMFMHWRMYRGHNCTNYVAYRLGLDGVPEPSYLLGNAVDWAKNAKKHGVAVDSFIIDGGKAKRLCGEPARPSAIDSAYAYIHRFRGRAGSPFSRTEAFRLALSTPPAEWEFLRQAFRNPERLRKIVDAAYQVNLA